MFGGNYMYSRNVVKEEPTGNLRDLKKNNSWANRVHWKEAEPSEGTASASWSTDRQTEALCRALPSDFPPRALSPGQGAGLSSCDPSPKDQPLHQSLAAPLRCLKPTSYSRHVGFKRHHHFNSPCSCWFCFI